MTENEFVSCVKRNNQRIFLIALSFTKSEADAEDILQNTFLKLWRHQEPFHNDDHLDKWLSRVCVNECKNYISSPFRKRSVSIDECKAFYTFNKEGDYDLFAAVMSLPKKERTVIHLFYFEDIPIKEISELLQVKESAVKTRLHRARKTLKEKLGEEWINE